MRDKIIEAWNNNEFIEFNILGHLKDKECWTKYNKEYFYESDGCYYDLTYEKDGWNVGYEYLFFDARIIGE
jgi:hypothetical protein